MSRATFLWAMVSVPALLSPQAASAQTAAQTEPDATSTGIQDIVVTAQRRAESVQKSSVAIEVLSADDIAQAGVKRARDLSVAVPGVQISQGGAATQIFIRGVGDVGTTAQSNPGIAFNIDGVYVARPAGIEGNFFDLERVEVLKGPQGTLYGRNATGGAINVITRKPEPGVRAMSGSIEVGNYQAITTEAAVNLPIGDTFAIRVAGQVASREPYVTMNFGDDVHQSIRGQALWVPDDRLTVRLSGDYIHVGGGGAESVPLSKIPGVSPWTSVTDPRVTPTFNRLAAAAGLCAPPFRGSPGALSNYNGGCPTVPFPIGPGGALVPVQLRQLVTPQEGATGRTNNRLWNLSAQIDYKLGFATLTVLPAYRKGSFDYATYPADYIFDVSAGGIPETSKATSLEVRLGNASPKLKWVVGGYYFNEDQFGVNQINSGVLQNIILLQEYHTKAYAAFGQATLTVVNGLRLIAGARYTSDNKIVGSKGSTTFFGVGSAQAAGLIGAGACVPANVLGTGILGCPTPVVPIGNRTFTKINWRAGFEYDLGPRNMVFATASTGFKSGGFYAGVLANGNRASYDPETLFSIEAGSRNRFLDNKLQINIDGFYYKYAAHQEPVVTRDALGTTIQALLNAGKGRVFGGSVDLVYQPSNNDTLHLGAEYVNSKYTSFVYQTSVIPGQPLFFPPGATGCPVTTSASSQTIDCSGFPLSRTPKWSGLASYSHRFDLADGGEIEAEGNLSFSSSRYLSTDYLPISLAGSYQLFNASLTYRPDANRLSISAFIRNITNEAIYTNAQRSPFVTGFSTGSINAPRTYGMRLNFKL